MSNESSGGSTGRSGAAQPRGEAALEHALETDRRRVASRYGNIDHVMRLVGGSPKEAQVLFLRGLLDNPQESRRFLENPKAYAVEHGVLLDPQVVRDVTNGLLFDVNVDPELGDRLGPRGTQALLDMRATHSAAAVPAAVAAGAAAVAAAAAVVEAVVTVVRASRAADLQALKGLGPNGIMLPGGEPFSF